MVVALKQFTMAGAHYGPPTDKTPLLAAKTAGEEARAAILAKVWMPGEETERDTRLADCADRIGRANHALQAAKLSRARQIPDDIWAAQRPRLRATLLRGRYVLASVSPKVPRKGSRARRAEVLAASR